MTNDPNKTDLTFATSDELIAELARRSDAVIVAYVLKAEDGGSHVQCIGHRVMCQGLALEIEDSVKLRIRRAHKAGEQA